MKPQSARALFVLIVGTRLFMSTAAEGQNAGSRDIAAEYATKQKVAAQNSPKEWLKWYQANVAEEYTVKDAKGKVITRKDLTKSIVWATKVPLKSNAMKVSLTVLVGKQTAKGDTVTVDVTENSLMQSISGYKSTVRVSETARDTWAKRSGKWMLTHRDVLTHQQSVDDKSKAGAKKPR